ncbi:hypothetical protein HYH02_006519 [Chlamydomonas schloesseri]|uniref:UBX domain-containing protein n=1 Tax=Chlamydomonas schloesseri TaxID=2026947 RepID=A0A835WJL7_9CHLO|nr:hypothetical protein HYH02_006519 [Chlamydomonas schloesseri]|eukprot:KAG2448631.1 hypothetical protein HYH02_006519 [Chlamydomonas schloesseri]
MANVKSLSDLNGEGDDDKPSKHNDYYAGGEKSGQLLRGAPEDESDEEDDRVGALFNRARQAGAAAGTSADLPGQPARAFAGQGHTLGGGPVPSKPPPETEGPRNHVITFYNNGIFTVDDGPPRRVDDPANLTFIESISKGECPAELDPGRPGAPVTVNLLRKEEPYSEPERPKQYFTGTGRTLGASTSAGASTSTASAAAAAADASAGEWKGVDESEPTTSLQLRLPDGSRMVARFNQGRHTVRDIRRFVRASRPDLSPAYQLMTAFPNKVIEGEDQTLEAAGLANAVIILKL